MIRQPAASVEVFICLLQNIIREFMLDIKLIRESPKLVEENLKKRNDPELIKKLKDLIKQDERYRIALKELEDLRHKRNKVSIEVAELKKQKKPADARIKEMKIVGDDIADLENEVNKLQEENRNLLLRIPNLLHESVPIGKDDKENAVLKKVGAPPKFKFQPKNHLDLLLDLGLIDQNRAAKSAGHGFFYLKNELVLLDLALQRYAIDFLMKKGFAAVNPPYMLQRKPYEGVTDLADFENVMYKIEKEDLYLIATSEHPIASMFMEETFLAENLPLKLAGISPCFRKEVGAHGKYTKGLFRMHQFNKVEQFVFSRPENSWKIHEELQKNTEELLKGLEIPFRVVNVCTGDIGSIASKKYDTEGLMADGEYREIGSNSNCTDYQARRLGIKFREKEGQAPIGFVHTLNNTAIATSRIMVCLLETHQKADGSIKLPKALWPYMNGLKELSKK